jgi:hypothetical protein
MVCLLGTTIILEALYVDQQVMLGETNSKYLQMLHLKKDLLWFIAVLFFEKRESVSR